jgi:hypothetical protein
MKVNRNFSLPALQPSAFEGSSSRWRNWWALAKALFCFKPHLKLFEILWFLVTPKFGRRLVTWTCSSVALDIDRCKLEGWLLSAPSALRARDCLMVILDHTSCTAFPVGGVRFWNPWMSAAVNWFAPKCTSVIQSIGPLILYIRFTYSPFPCYSELCNPYVSVDASILTVNRKETSALLTAFQMFLNKQDSMVWVRERTIPTERPPLFGEVIANFCG